MNGITTPPESMPTANCAVDVASLEAAYAAAAVVLSASTTGRAGHVIASKDATAPLAPAVRFVALLVSVLIVSAVVMVLLTALGVQR